MNNQVFCMGKKARKKFMIAWNCTTRGAWTWNCLSSQCTMSIGIQRHIVPVNLKAKNYHLNCNLMHC